MYQMSKIRRTTSWLVLVTLPGRTCADVGPGFVIKHRQKNKEEFDPAEIQMWNPVYYFPFFFFVMTSCKHRHEQQRLVLGQSIKTGIPMRIHLNTLESENKHQLSRVETSGLRHRRYQNVTRYDLKSETCLIKQVELMRCFYEFIHVTETGFILK